jgi:preprotein translocase subunit Sec61beta
VDDLKQASQRRMSFVATVKAVLWSFFGVRKKSAYEEDTQKLNPVHVIIAGIIAAVLFVLALLLLVKIVVAT